MNRLVWILLCSWAAAAATACGSPGGSGADDAPDGGVPDDSSMPDEPTWSFDDVYGVANLDDDDGSQSDWSQNPFPTDNDLSTLTLPAATLALVPDGGTVELSLTGDTENVRIYDGTTHILGAQLGPATFTFTPTGADHTFSVELGTYLARAELTLTAKDSAGAVTHTTTTLIQAAPLIINHHLQPAEAVWVVTSGSNASMIDTYQEVLGDKFTAVSGFSVEGDVWIQDEFEFATMVGTQAQRLDVVIDSVRNRGLQNLSRSFVGADGITQTWGSVQAATTYDSFGNLEATPPFTLNGVAYPFGKIYYGRLANRGLNTTLGNFLASQRVQAPFQIDTTWLCVGHVDEFISFVPDPTAPKGFRLLIADTTAAWNIIDALPGSSSLPLYDADHGYPTVASLRTDDPLRALNDDIQADYLDPTVAKFKAELGLTDDEIIRIPSLFEQVNRCDGRVAALIPGMVNLVVANVDGATTHLFTADPFFRATVSQDADPIIAAFRAAMPPSLTLHFVDDWDTYHINLGEVHCGTNVRRTPTTMWWDAALHLLEGN